MLDKLKVVCGYAKSILLTILGICIILVSTIIFTPVILYCKIGEAIEYRKFKHYRKKTLST